MVLRISFLNIILNLDNLEGTGNGIVQDKFFGKQIPVTLCKCRNNSSVTKIKEFGSISGT